MDTIAFWKEVAKARATLPDTPTVYLISVDCASPRISGGVIAEVPREKAGEFIAIKTHRLATEAEIKKHHTDNDAARQAIVKAEYERKQQFALPKEVTDMIAAAVGAAKSKGKAE